MSQSLESPAGNRLVLFKTYGMVKIEMEKQIICPGTPVLTLQPPHNSIQTTDISTASPHTPTTHIIVYKLLIYRRPVLTLPPHT